MRVRTVGATNQPGSQPNKAESEHGEHSETASQSVSRMTRQE